MLRGLCSRFQTAHHQESIPGGKVGDLFLVAAYWAHLGVKGSLPDDPKRHFVESAVNIRHHSFGFQLAVHTRMTEREGLVERRMSFRQTKNGVVSFLAHDRPIFPAN